MSFPCVAGLIRLAATPITSGRKGPATRIHRPVPSFTGRFT
jgi:hypothetical protein